MARPPELEFVTSCEHDLVVDETLALRMGEDETGSQQPAGVAWQPMADAPQEFECLGGEELGL